MLIQGSSKPKRTELLVEKYCSLLDSGVKAEEVLVLLQNPVKKENFITSFKQKLKINHYENPQIYTFYGLCYNTILENWPVVENSISLGNPVITPHLTGLEISRLLLNSAIKEVDFKDYNSKLNLMHQLFRRHSLISNNNLSDEQVKECSRILKESFGDDAQKALNIYKSKTIQYRAFDYLRQLNIFTYLYQKTDCFKDIKYLILDDADEITPAEFDFVKDLYSKNVQCTIAYDRHGSSRLGFLNADIKTVERLEELFSEEEVVTIDEVLHPVVNLEQASFSRRQEMLQKALEKVDDLLNNGVSPNEIAIISPIIDSSLKCAAKEYFAKKGVSYQFISGSEKLAENKLVHSCITVLKLTVGADVDVFDARCLLSDILFIPIKYCLPVISEYNNSKQFKSFDLGYAVYTERLEKFVAVLDELKTSDITLSEKLFAFYEKMLSIASDFCVFDSNSYEKFVFFAKQIKDFEEVFSEYKNRTTFQKTILNQLSNSIISENPSSSPAIEENTVLISTPQKIIDLSYRTKYQIWLDTTSHEWQHDDFGMLYNAWVFQSSWEKDSFSNEDNLYFSNIKTQKMLRKLALLAEDGVYTYSSLFDTLGAENFGTVEETLRSVCNISAETTDAAKDITFNFVPRDDQKPVLDYKGGKMAISAVPGAGKTTILLALIIKLLQQGVEGENIFVLTYMDSAARNFKDKIKQACPNLEKMPNISTIHGLALRILKENSNYVKAGLDENFDVCDDIQRQKILREVVAHCMGDADDMDKYDKAISALKLSDLRKKPYTKDAELLKFLKIFNTYNSVLKNKNLIDYEDMLVLSVKILEQNPDIAAYYQDICRYVIEDEAQDSSSVQQKLISILSAKHKNLIRCGDINQAITTTFTNTDLDGFRDFVKTSQNVLMSQSQRCAKEVYELANRLVSYASSNDTYKNAFYDIKMQEVKGENPVSENAVTSKIFEDFNEERAFILENVRKIFAQDKEASVAVLVRNNSQAEEYASFLGAYGYNIITGSEALEKQPVFNLLFSLMNFCAHPWQNDTVVEFANVLKEQRFIKLSSADITYLKELKTPFILQNKDDIDSPALIQLLWDLNYWLENSSISSNIEDFSIKAGMYYYTTEVEKSNIYLASFFFKSVKSQYSSIEAFLDRLREVKSRPVGSKYKFFDDTDEHETQTTNCAIQIMTYHKSKGGEFDYVFIPALNEEYLQFNPESIKIKSKERFIEAVKALNFEYKKKNETELKLFQIEENFRLLYVAITRAKKKLYITTAKNCKKFSRVKKTEPSVIFETLLNKSGANHACQSN